MTYTHLTLKSSNSKTGPIPVSTTTAETCPDACPLKKKGCYGGSGPLALHWRKVTEQKRGMAWNIFVKTIAMLPDNQLWRHDQVGDLPGKGNRINKRELSDLVAANKFKRGYTYTHKPMTPANQIAVKQANDNGFVINLSANNAADADRLSALRVAPVVTLLPKTAPKVSHTPQGRKIVVCPAQSRDGITCATCKLCAKKDRDYIIGFRSHGNASKTVDKIASE